MNKPYGALYCYFVQGRLFSSGKLQIIVYEHITVIQSFYFFLSQLNEHVCIGSLKYIYNCKDQKKYDR